MYPPAFWWGVAGCALLAVGGLAPWVTVLSVSISGTELHGYGWVTLGAGAAALAALVAFRDPSASGPIAIVCALIGGGLAVVEIADISSNGVAQPGWGIYAAAAGGITVIVASAALNTRSSNNRR